MQEINRAAERLRLREAGSSIRELYGEEAAWCLPVATQLVMQDLHCVARAYLAEHLPDDDEPLSVEFMDSLSVARTDYGDAIWWEIGNVSVRAYSKINFSVYYKTTQVDKIATRGKLRQLLKAMQ